MSGAQTELHGNAVLMREEKQYLGRVSLGRDYMLVIEPGRAERHYWHDCDVTGNFFESWLGTMVKNGRMSAHAARSRLLVAHSDVAFADFFLWLGIPQFRKMEKSFADLI
jgi:hypothetical protein